MKRSLLLVISFVLISNMCKSQCNGWANFQSQDSVFTNPAFGVSTTAEKDRLHRPYVYLANTNGGLKVYDLTPVGTPTVSANISKSALGNLGAINLYQDSIWLYVALGDIWDTTELPGLAIIDVSDPASPVILDTFVYQGLTGGAGDVKVKGNYAYLAANQNGLVILDISNKSNIQYVSTLPLDMNFPHSPMGAASMFNARGIELKGNNAYIAFDRGGFRIVDISNVNSPSQVGQYCSDSLINKATAYNNVVVHNNIAYVAIDYYGMEILDVSNPAAITQISHWHPANWAPATNDYGTWNNALGHANEIAYDSVCQKIYMSAGKSDVVSIDVSNPANPTTCEVFGSTSDAYGTWGLDFYDNAVYLAYIWSPFFPPHSNYTGFRELLVNCSAVGINNNELQNQIQLFPNPASDKLEISLPQAAQTGILSVNNILGSTVKKMHINETTSFHINVGDLPEGVYVLSLDMKDRFISKRFIVKH